MNKSLIILTLSIFFVSSIIITDLYTTNQLNSATESLVQKLEYKTSQVKNGKWTPWVNQPELIKLDLADYLTSNRNGLTNFGDDWGKHKFWLNQCSKNPSLVYSAISTFLPNTIRKYNSIIKRQCASAGITVNTEAYWKTQVESINDYQRLITVLLDLPDDDLDFYLSNVTEADYSYEFNEFLFEQGLLRIRSLPKHSSPVSTYSKYPGDFLNLAYRVCEKDSEWSYRRFFEEALLASEEIETVLLPYVE